MQKENLEIIKQKVIKYRELIVVGTLGLIVLGFAAFRISGTSIYHYYELLQNQVTKHDELLVGTPKFIRADEWNLVTSYTLSQSLTGYQPVNPFVADGQEMSAILDVPTTHWSSLFKPSNYIFFISPDVEFAFAFKWWFRGAVLITAIYFLLKKLTSRFDLSFLGGIIFFFTPFIQWWYSTPAVEVTAYLSFVTFFVLNILSAKTRKAILLNSLGLAYFAICTVMMLYPPFTISVALGMGALILGYTFSHFKFIREHFFFTKVLGLILGLVIAGGVVVLDYLSLKQTIDIILNTKYPGSRFLTGGGMNLQVLFSGLLNFRLPDLSIATPSVLVNSSEASNYFLTGLLLIPIVLFNSAKDLIRKMKPDWITVMITLYLIVSLIWVLFGLPEIVAKFTLLGKVPTARMLIGIGTFTYILSFYYLSKTSLLIKFDLRTILSRTVLIGAFVAFYVYIVSTFQTDYPGYLGIGSIVIILGFALISSITLLFGFRRAFLLSLLAFSIYSVYRINPFYKGLDVSKDISIIQEVKTIDQVDGGKSRWAVFNDALLGNLLIANGIHTINGTHIYPQFKMWRTLDPEGKLDFYYDRYAHVAFFPADSGFKFIDTVQQDIALLEIDPCLDFFTQNGVKFVISLTQLSHSCLTPIKTVFGPDIVRPFYIYQRS